MVKLPSFDNNKDGPFVGFEPLPDGKYQVEITHSEVKQKALPITGTLINEVVRYDVVDEELPVEQKTKAKKSTRRTR